MEACVYAITHVATGDTYIGATAQQGRRWTYHRYNLRNGKHRNSRLQAAWDKFGETAFEFRRLIVCRLEDLQFYEERLIRHLRPAFNVLLNTSVVEMCRRLGISHKTVSVRLHRGMSLDDALRTPIVARVRNGKGHHRRK